MATKKINYTKKGKKNSTLFNEFVVICKMTQKELKEYLESALKLYYPSVVSEDGFIYAKGNIPYLLTAHMDTVHKQRVKDYYEYYDEKNGNHIISSPQGIGGDDRCGIYMILKILIETDLRPSILFCEDEEIGRVGADKFCKTEYIKELEELNYLIELDRAGSNDSVYYDCANDEFEDFINTATGFKTEWGSFSDISSLSPACMVASVNLSCGYYNAHTTDEYVVMEELNNTMQIVILLLSMKSEKYEYIEDYSNYFSYNYGYGYFGKNKYSSSDMTVEFEYLDDNGEEEFDIADGVSLEECLGKFLIGHPTLSLNDIFNYSIY